MDEITFVQKIPWVQHDYQKEFLKSENADIFFVFDVKNSTSIRIPGHKSILAASSSVFKNVFDETEEIREIPLPAKIRKAFEEFLQFFYKNILTLTFKNMFAVAKLCKCFAIIDRFKACEIPLQQSLTIESMCIGYGVADFVGLTNLVNFCEQEIENNAEEICSSEQFTQMHPAIFDKVLKFLISADCSASMLINSSRIWCKKNSKNRRDYGSILCFAKYRRNE